MGWPASYRLSTDAHGGRVTKTTITKLVGNGVCLNWAAAHIRANCADLTEAVIASGHWMAQEKPVEVNAALARWLATRFPGLWRV